MSNNSYGFFAQSFVEKKQASINIVRPWVVKRAMKQLLPVGWLCRKALSMMFISNGMGGMVVVLSWTFLFGFTIMTSGAVNGSGQYVG